MACTEPGVDDPADEYLQCLIDEAEPGETLVLKARRYILDGLPTAPVSARPDDRRIRVRKPLTIDFNGAELFFRRISGAHKRNKGFLVAPQFNSGEPYYDREFEFVNFENGRFIGQLDSFTPFNDFQGVISSISEGGKTLKVGRMSVDSCVFKNLSSGILFNTFSSGYIRQSVLSNCVFDNIVVDPAKQNDSERGRAATFSLPYQKPTQCSGLSLGNVFRGCQRHSIYVFSGGPFLSEGDKFIDGSLANVGSYPVAAVSLKGGSGFDEDDPDVVGKQGGDHMRVANGYFENCKVGIALTRARPAIRRIRIRSP